jgi:hypothetical protein
LGTFSEVCPGGRPLPHAAEALTQACRQASAAGLRGGLVAPCIAYMVAMFFFFLSGRSMRARLDD